MNNIDSSLMELYNDYKSRPFVYGITDCASFVDDWVRRYKGLNIKSEFNSYTNSKQALAVLLKRGFNNQDEMLDSYFKRIQKSYLRRGDLTGHYFNTEQKIMAIGVYTGEVSMFKSGKGIETVNYRKINNKLCWRVK